MVVWWAGACGAIAGLRFRLGSALDLAEACRLCARPENSEAAVWSFQAKRLSLQFGILVPFTNHIGSGASNDFVGGIREPLGN